MSLLERESGIERDIKLETDAMQIIIWRILWKMLKKINQPNIDSVTCSQSQTR